MAMNAWVSGLQEGKCLLIVAMAAFALINLRASTSSDF
jgi:hypothetical protein